MNEKMPLDVRTYKAKSYFSIFTQRQFFLLVGCAITDILLYSFLKRTSLDSTTMLTILLGLDLCILSFLLKVYDVIPLDQFLLKIVKWGVGKKEISFVEKREKIKQEKTSKKKKNEGYL